jgi:hypothetical protein
MGVRHGRGRRSLRFCSGVLWGLADAAHVRVASVGQAIWFAAGFLSKHVEEAGGSAFLVARLGRRSAWSLQSWRNHMILHRKRRWSTDYKIPAGVGTGLRGDLCRPDGGDFFLHLTSYSFRFLATCTAVVRLKDAVFNRSPPQELRTHDTPL